MDAENQSPFMLLDDITLQNINITELLFSYKINLDNNIQHLIKELNQIEKIEKLNCFHFNLKVTFGQKQISNNMFREIQESIGRFQNLVQLSIYLEQYNPSIQNCQGFQTFLKKLINLKFLTLNIYSIRSNSQDLTKVLERIAECQILTELQIQFFVDGIDYEFLTNIFPNEIKKQKNPINLVVIWQSEVAQYSEIIERKLKPDFQDQSNLQIQFKILS